MSVRKFFGGLLIMVGSLVAIFSGGCTLFFILFFGAYRMGDYYLVFSIGGMPFVVGLVLFGLGKLIYGSDNKDMHYSSESYDDDIESLKPGKWKTKDGDDE